MAEFKLKGIGRIQPGNHRLEIKNVKVTRSTLIVTVQRAVEYEIHEVAAGAYLRSDRRGKWLTHAVVDGHVLCGRVKCEHLLHDTLAPGYRKNTGEPTCRICRARLRKKCGTKR